MALRQITLALALLLASAPHLQAADLRLTKAIWGFSNSLVPSRLSLLSVQIFNADHDTFAGSIQLLEFENSTNLLKPTLRLRQVEIAPRSHRWLQFPLFPAESEARWALRWGPGPDQSEDIPEAKASPFTRCVLVEEQRAAPTPFGIPRYPEQLWPPSVAFTDGLAELHLDFLPNWTTPQQLALREWLYAGGQLHLYPRTDMRPLLFEGVLSELNGSEPKSFFGQGRIIRHSSPPSSEPPPKIDHPVSPKPNSPQTGSKKSSPTDELWNDDPNIAFTAALQQSLPKPNISWAALTILSILYLILIGPIGAWIGLKKRRTALDIAFLTIVILIFTLFFLWLGQRGYGETSRIHAVSYARPCAPQQAIVREWGQIFLTSSQQLTLKHSSPTGAFALASYSLNRALLNNGNNPSLTTDIPLFSSRGYTFAGTLPMPDLIQSFPTKIPFTLVTKDSLNPNAQIFMVHSNVISQLIHTGNNKWGSVPINITIYGDDRQPREVKNPSPAQYLFANRHYYTTYDTPTWESVIQNYSYNYNYRSDLNDFCNAAITFGLRLCAMPQPTPSDQADLFIWTDAPKEWAPESWTGAIQHKVLYHWTVPVDISKK